MEIRTAQKSDLKPLLELYTQLHDNTMPQLDQHLEELWRRILEDRYHQILLGVIDGRIVSSCVLIIIPNLTNNQRPYALIENVITHPDCRGNGYASQLLEHAKKQAMTHKCYKIMLMTSSKSASTWMFYERAGYNRMDKTAFIQWLE